MLLFVLVKEYLLGSQISYSRLVSNLCPCQNQNPQRSAHLAKIYPSLDLYQLVCFEFLHSMWEANGALTAGLSTVSPLNTFLLQILASARQTIHYAGL